MAGPSVLVLGAGVAGLTAAHELAERGFAVTVLEAGRVAGGKSRSIDAEGTGRDGRRPLPGEHGFRFFPGFYRHLPDTMRRIPYRDRSDGVLGNLVVAPRTEGLTVGHGSFVAPNRLPTGLDDLPVFADFLWHALWRSQVDIPQEDMRFFVERLLTALTSCEARQNEELEHVSFWDFAEAERRSPAYQRYCVDAVTRTLVACRAREISARTWAIVGGQLLFDAFRSAADRVLTGPTSEVWIDPWVAHLEGLGVRFVFETRVEKLVARGKKVVAVEVADADGSRVLSADHVVLALPLERVIPLVDDAMLAVEPKLAGLGRLQTAWMAGAILYLDRALPFVCGHTTYLDSPWALTSVAHEQFWPEIDLRARGDGRVRGVLSVCVSAWDTPGIRYGLPARACSREQIRDEVIAQVRAHLAPGLRAAFDEAEIVDFFLDPGIAPGPDGVLCNETPLLVNTVASWQHRPTAATAFDNLVLAGDYVQTTTDLATMEGANEAARRAVNVILDRVGSEAARCPLFALETPGWVADLRALDALRYAQGRPHALPTLARDGQVVARAVQRAFRELAPVASSAGVALAGAGVDRLVGDLWTKLVRAAAAVEPTTGAPPAPPAPSTRSFWAMGEPPGAGLLDELLGDETSDDAPTTALRVRGRVALAEVDALIRASVTELVRGRVSAAAEQLLAVPGKRVRAVTALLAAAAVDGSIPPASIAIAAAAELVHAASLLHDDIIDEATLRRGRTTAHVAHGTAAGILGGNLLAAKASALLLAHGAIGPARGLLAVIDRMIAAEAEQLERRGTARPCHDAYARIIAGKTGALFAWSAERAGQTAGLDDRACDALREVGERAGVVFQLVDDVIDFEGDAALLGKKALRDLEEGKWTYPVIAAVERRPALGERLAQAAETGRLQDEALRDELLFAVRGTGALRETRERALAEAALARQALAVLPNAPPRRALAGLVHWAAQRTR